MRSRMHLGIDWVDGGNNTERVHKQLILARAARWRHIGQLFVQVLKHGLYDFTCVFGKDSAICFYSGLFQILDKFWLNFKFCFVIFVRNFPKNIRKTEFRPFRPGPVKFAKRNPKPWSSHDFIPISQPQFREWIPLYGRVFLYWFGSTPNICVADFGMAKQLLSDRTGLFPKNRMNPIVRLVGKGLVMTDGDVWHRHKKVVHPAFNVDKLKVMTSTMVDCALSMASRWEAQLASQGNKDCQEIELTSQFEELTADVISRTAFGSSYREGRKIFLALNEIQFIAFSTLFTDYIPGFRFVPTKKNMRLWKLNKMMRSTLVQIIENRLAAKDTDGYGNDLLGLMLEACAPEHGQAPLLSMDEIIDECKTFFFAGQETSLHMLNWTMFLLGTHPEWQEKLRQEVLRECGRDRVPTYDMLNRLRLVNLFLLETLRLYSPVPLIRRRTRSEVELGGITVPRDALLTIPIATIHRDKEVWGEDADEFNPMRFDASGGAVRAASHLNALMSFSMGPRTCIGQNFAMVEAKAEVAVILRRFVLSLSRSYVHAPTDVITLRPKYGLPMIITRLDA